MSVGARVGRVLYENEQTAFRSRSARSRRGEPVNAEGKRPGERLTSSSTPAVLPAVLVMSFSLSIRTRKNIAQPRFISPVLTDSVPQPVSGPSPPGTCHLNRIAPKPWTPQLGCPFRGEWFHATRFEYCFESFTIVGSARTLCSKFMFLVSQSRSQSRAQSIFVRFFS